MCNFIHTCNTGSLERKSGLTSLQWNMQDRTVLSKSRLLFYFFPSKITQEGETKMFSGSSLEKYLQMICHAEYRKHMKNKWKKKKPVELGENSIRSIPASAINP